MNKEMIDFDEDNIFTDKIKLSKDLISSEGQIIMLYNKIHNRLKIGEIIEIDLYVDGDYFSVWQHLMELYDFLEFKYVPKLLELKDGKKDYDKLIELVKEYRDKNKILKFEDLKFTYNTVRKVMQLSGFHDVTTSGKGKTDFLKPRQDWSGVEF